MLPLFCHLRTSKIGHSSSRKPLSLKLTDRLVVREGNLGFHRRHYAKKKKKDETTTHVTDSSLDAVMAQLSSTFGDGTVSFLGSSSTTTPPATVTSISTGSLTLDLALGIGGLPRRRIVEIYGPESSGKTTLALSVVAQTQKAGGRAAYIDVEHSIDPSWAKKLGVKIEDLLFAQPDSGEEALEIADTLASSGKVDVIVVDSVAALVPKSELEGNMGDSQVGVQARLMSHALRKLTSGVSKNNALIIFINQIRMKIGVLFGNPETTSGGNALKFYASVRLEVRKGGQLKVGEDVIGSQLRVKVVKNKVGPPFKVAEFDLLFDSGISKSGEILDLAVKENLIVKSGAWYTIPAEIVNEESKEGQTAQKAEKKEGEKEETIIKLGQGREKARLYLEQHKDLMDQLELELRKRLLNSTTPSVASVEGDALVVDAEPEM